MAGATSHGAMAKVDEGHGKFIGMSAAPSSQTIYGIVLMFVLLGAVGKGQGLALFALGQSAYPDSNYFPVVRERRVGALREEIAHFIDSLASGTPPLVSGEDGLKAVIVCDAIKRSAAEGREVSLSWPA